MYSEFTVKLINEVRKREILYNNKYDKRPRAEKDKCWEDIARKLGADAEKCKKHWKNVRDRFVKIKHARDKHFLNNGSELTAPGYIYYDMLSFMTEFSVRKVVTNSRDAQSIEMQEITPEPLLLTENDKITDMTRELIDEVKNHPILYDASAEFRQYRGQNAWKHVADALDNKFPPPTLRHYWVVLMKQYKLYSEHQHELVEPVKNENIFKMLTFVTLNQSQDEGEQLEFITFEDSCKMEQEDSHNPIINMVGEAELDDNYESSDAHTSHQNFQTEQSEDDSFVISHGIFGSEPKRMKFSKKKDLQPRIVKAEGGIQDEFDYFGKKVAMQLRNLAKKNQKLSRKAEIEVLQLLMNFEDRAEENSV